MKRVLLPIAILVGCVLFAGFLYMTPAQVSETSPEVIPVAVRVAQVELDSVRLIVESQGKVQAAQLANLSALVAGPIEWISPAMQAGGYVEAGQVLLRLETSDYETARARSRAAMQQAQAEVNHANTDLERMKELTKQRLASDSQLQDAIRTADVNAARLADALASFRQTELDLERAEIKAPFNAIIETREVELGQYVNRAQSVAILYGADEVEVRLPLAIRQLGYLDIPLGTRGELVGNAAPDVSLTGFYGGEEHHWRGKLVRTEATIDPNSNTVQAIIRVQQPVAGDTKLSRLSTEQIPLPIGLFVQANIVGKEAEDMIALPRSVIRNNSQVLVVDAENKMYFRDVEIFRLEEDRVLISGGLLAGEYICTSPIQAVVNGMSVQPVIENI
ncbi:MAG TPA: efflux RND transporter periplasmic adaptor subunit [Porticoccaceae bacterium]|jgi:RND family efflux transporter MFP subunit|nr:efflux RND transporter periplasmic adaptor subunit [Gammaproteobacteria bacterium]HIL59910.1 efflux RND transporter periplasmic adaptor subunit [Porticoccaceae bacterium]